MGVGRQAFAVLLERKDLCSLVLRSDKRNLVELLNLTVVACSFDLFLKKIISVCIFEFLVQKTFLQVFWDRDLVLRTLVGTDFKEAIRYNFQTPSGYTDDNASGNKQGCCVKPTWLVWLHGNKDAQQGLLTL